MFMDGIVVRELFVENGFIIEIDAVKFMVDVCFVFVELYK